SALGLLAADTMKVQGRTQRMPLDEAAPAALRAAHAEMQRAAAEEFRALGLDGALDFALEADMRFLGQAFEIPVPIEAAALPGLTAAELAARF
ncbi:hypothetical protein OFM36_31565, partial [Escherichia coli]|nr:hypothetical protein [Escherichia coli]